MIIEWIHSMPIRASPICYGASDERSKDESLNIPQHEKQQIFEGTALTILNNV